MSTRVLVCVSEKKMVNFLSFHDAFDTFEWLACLVGHPSIGLLIDSANAMDLEWTLIARFCDCLASGAQPLHGLWHEPQCYRRMEPTIDSKNVQWKTFRKGEIEKKKEREDEKVGNKEKMHVILWLSKPPLDIWPTMVLCYAG